MLGVAGHAGLFTTSSDLARYARMLLAGLPSLVKVSVRGSNAGVWLEASLRYALAEARSPRPGGAGVLAKLAEVLFIEVLRLHMNEQGTGRKGWLAGVGDRIVGAALNALHHRPAHAWTLEELAREAARRAGVGGHVEPPPPGFEPAGLSETKLDAWRRVTARGAGCALTVAASAALPSPHAGRRHRSIARSARAAAAGRLCSSSARRPVACRRGWCRRAASGRKRPTAP